MLYILTRFASTIVRQSYPLPVVVGWCWSFFENFVDLPACKLHHVLCCIIQCSLQPGDGSAGVTGTYERRVEVEEVPAAFMIGRAGILVWLPNGKWCGVGVVSKNSAKSSNIAYWASPALSTAWLEPIQKSRHTPIARPSPFSNNDSNESGWRLFPNALTRARVLELMPNA